MNKINNYMMIMMTERKMTMELNDNQITNNADDDE